ncbi:MAG: RNA polymerase sigma factor [Chloroflexi bacterium]|nr:RNA polymerase sigma factor [Chloroflexota bacterium]
MQTRIVEDLRAGHPEALDLLLETYGREIQAVAFLIVRDRFDAEDIAVETLLTAWKRASQLRDPDGLRPWLLRIAANKSLTHRRRSARIVPLDAVSERRDPLGQPDVTRVALLQGIDELPPAMRAALVLRYYADLSMQETAAALGKSPNTIKAQLQVALDRLRLSLSDAEPIDAQGLRHA